MNCAVCPTVKDWAPGVTAIESSPVGLPQPARESASPATKSALQTKRTNIASSLPISGQHCAQSIPSNRPCKRIANHAMTLCGDNQSLTSTGPPSGVLAGLQVSPEVKRSIQTRHPSKTANPRPVSGIAPATRPTRCALPPPSCIIPPTARAPSPRRIQWLAIPVATS